VGVVFKHIRPAVIGLILFAFWQLASLTFIGDGETVNWLSLVAFMALLALMLSFKKVHPIVWIAVGAVFGVVFL
ncbi:MAG: chromate transporter, partial [Spirochaetales bacterium]|nr:chromate transporter [Spirochaetales bacterium]